MLLHTFNLYSSCN